MSTQEEEQYASRRSSTALPGSLQGAFKNSRVLAALRALYTIIAHVNLKEIDLK